jgi:hypothetical protein
MYWSALSEWHVTAVLRRCPFHVYFKVFARESAQTAISGISRIALATGSLQHFETRGAVVG